MRVRSERGDALIGLEMTNGHVNGFGIAAKPYAVRLDRQQIVVDPDISTHGTRRRATAARSTLRRRAVRQPL